LGAVSLPCWGAGFGEMDIELLRSFLILLQLQNGKINVDVVSGHDKTGSWQYCDEIGLLCATCNRF